MLYVFCCWWYQAAGMVEFLSGTRRSRSPGWSLMLSIEAGATGKTGPRGHVWGFLLCPHAERGGCRVSVFTTPRNPDDHAAAIRSAIASCPHETYTDWRRKGNHT